MSRVRHRQPTEEVAAPSSWREIAVTVIGVVGVVGLVNLALVFAPTSNTGYLALEQKWRMLGELDEAVDLLVLGDSSCRQGLVPDVVASRLGLESALNLCTTGNALVLNDAWMLESYLERIPPPRAVLVIHSFDILIRELSLPTVARIPLEWGFWSRLAPHLRPGPGGLAQLFAARYVPLYASDRTVRGFAMRPLRSLRRYREFGRRLDEQGFVAEDRAYPGGVRSDTRRRVRFLSENPFRVTAPNRAAVERLRALAERHRVPVYLVHAPVYEGLARSAPFQSHFRRMSDYFRAQAAGSEHLRYVPDLVTFPAEVMQNSDHVTLPAAMDYSMAVASRIGADLSSRATGTAGTSGTGETRGSCVS